MRQHPPILQAAPDKVCRLPVVSQSDRGRFLPLPDHRDTSLISWHCHSMTVARRMPARASRLVARPACLHKKYGAVALVIFSILINATVPIFLKTYRFPYLLTIFLMISHFASISSTSLNWVLARSRLWPSLWILK